MYQVLNQRPASTLTARGLDCIFVSVFPAVIILIVPAEAQIPSAAVALSNTAVLGVEGVSVSREAHVPVLSILTRRSVIILDGKIYLDAQFFLPKNPNPNRHFCKSDYR